MQTEDSQATSLATELHAMRPAFPTELFDGVHWERLLARAAEVPAEALEDVFGFEVRLGRPEPASDLCIVVPAEGEVTSHFIGRARSDAGGARDTHSPTRPGALQPDARSGAGRRRLARQSLAACLLEIASVGTFANRAIAHGATMLEYDVVESKPGSRPSPGVFWSLADSVGPSQTGQLARLLAIASGLAVRPVAREEPAAGAPREAGWAAALCDVVRAATPYGRISQVGTFVGRRGAGVRVIVSRVEHEAVAHLLDAVRWPGPVTAATEAIATCAGPCPHLAVALDVGSGGVGPRLGLELAMPDGWAGSRWRQWRPLVDTLAAKGLCRADKALGLKRWCGLTRLYGRQMYLLAKGINHVKLGIREDAVEAKAYLGACRRRAEDAVPA